jgi:fructose-1,6-bisphosphatase-3
MSPPNRANDAVGLERAALRFLSQQYPNANAVAAAIASRSAELLLPKETIHVISDIHGDSVKLRHVINNASGTLRPLVEQHFASRLDAAEMREFLSLLHYPKETLEHLADRLREPEVRRTFCRRTMGLLFELARLLARKHTLARLLALLPSDYRPLLTEALREVPGGHGEAYLQAIIDSLSEDERVFELLRVVVRLIRNLAIDELIIAGDCWDRGKRGDRVVGYIMQQPHVSFIWGNHDAAWLGAALGHEALIAHVLRISTRYRCLSQLEEGYGITLQPLENLVRTVYADDPAGCFKTKGSGLRPTLLMAQMQKAAAIMQFKLEGQLIERNPQFDLAHRRLLHRLDPARGLIEIDGRTRTLKDRNFPTIDWQRPYELSPEEQTCLRRIRQSFLTSQVLREQMVFLVNHGAMYLLRDDHLIFHGCVPVDERGSFLTLAVDGEPKAGKALFDALNDVLARVIHQPATKDLDLLWYLWCGPRSPLFGKDRITTLENDLVAEAETHVETKNPYFQLIHEVDFCERVLAEFGANTKRGLIVNGHVPVKIDKGEQPLKRSGKAITIDGAFSEAYGDHGYTLILEPHRTALAKHHHLESVEAAVAKGLDIIPTVSELRRFEPPRTIGDTEQGDAVRAELAWLDRLLQAYQRNEIRPPN